MQKHRRLWLLSTLLITLIGCNREDETAVQDSRTDRTLPIGYHSNEKHEKNGGNAVLLDGADNDGPVTEIMDHTMGTERETNQRFFRVNDNNNNNNDKNQVKQTNQMTNRDQDNLNSGESLIGGSDQNYHGHLSNSNHSTRQSYNNDSDGNVSERITRATEDVENVKEAHTVIYGNKVVVGVRLHNKEQDEETKRKIQQAVKDLLNGKSAQLITDESQFNRLKTIENDLRNGGPKEVLNKDMQNLIRVNDNK